MLQRVVLSASLLLACRAKQKQQPQVPQSSYQQYMTMGGGGAPGGAAGGATGGYQNFMAQYSGNYANYYAQYTGHSQGSTGGGTGFDYSQYMSQYGSHSKNSKSGEEGNCSFSHTVASHMKAMNKTQLRAWRNAQECATNNFMPASYSAYARKDIANKYNQRLRELNNATAREDLTATVTTSASHSKSDSTSASSSDSSSNSIWLLEKSANHTGAESATDLRHSANERVLHVEALAKSFGEAAKDKDAIEENAALPAKRARDAFAKQRSQITAEMHHLSAELKQRKTSSTAQIATAERSLRSRILSLREHATAARNAELRLLRDNTRQAESASRHAARGMQATARSAAREARTKADKLARKYWDSDGEMATRLSNRAQAAADAAQDHSEELARRTQDSLERHQDEAERALRKGDTESLELLEESNQSMEKASTFLARSSAATTSSSLSTTAAALAVFLVLALVIAQWRIRSKASMSIRPQQLLG